LELHQVIPQEATVQVPEILAGLHLEEQAGTSRPYTAVNFIASADGRSTFQGRSAPLGDLVDREVFHGLREQAEAVIAGTHTARIERYGRMIKDPERRARRLAAGRSPEPLFCLVTRSGDVPVEAPIFSEPEARVVVFGPAELESPEVEAQLEVVRLDPGELTLTTALRRLRSEFGVRSLLCEGGPTIYNGLLHEHLVDEMFLTLAPKLTGGGAEPAITNGPELPTPQSMSLVWVLESDSSLYLRYRLT
jgi:riboflavin biosynthesis pyrimidine reductase